MVTGIVIRWTAWRRCTELQQTLTFCFPFSCVLVVCKAALCIPPPTVLNCVHTQACTGTERHYECEGDQQGAGEVGAGLGSGT